MKHLLLLIAFACTIGMAAQKNCKAYRGNIANSYNYWFYTPDEDEGDDVHRPLLVFLHGQSLCGNNLERVKTYGPMDALKRGRVIDCYLIAPQNPGGAWNPQKIMKIIEWAEANYKVDSNRIYVYGMSLGGFGTMDMAATYPDRIAAALAMCGGATAKDLSRLNDIPLWIVHGTADAAVPISQSDRVVAEMKRADPTTPRLIYTRLPGASHGAPARCFYMYQTYDWLFSHSLQDEDRPINKDFEYTNENLKTAYKDLGRNADFSQYE